MRKSLPLVAAAMVFASAAQANDFKARVLGSMPFTETVRVEEVKCVESPDPDAPAYKPLAQRNREAVGNATLSGSILGALAGAAYADKYNTGKPGLALLSIASGALWGGTAANQVARAHVGQEWWFGEAKPQPADPGPPPVPKTCQRFVTEKQVPGGYLVELRLNGQNVIARSPENLQAGKDVWIRPNPDGTFGFLAEAASR